MKKIILILVVLLSVANAMHEPEVDLQPEWTAALEDNDYVFDVCNNGSDPIKEVRIYQNPSYTGFGCEEKDSWTLQFIEDFPDRELGVVDMCWYYTNTTNTIDAGECSQFLFSATAPGAGQCGLTWKFETRDDQLSIGNYIISNDDTSVDDMHPAITKTVAGPAYGDCPPGEGEECWITTMSTIYVDVVDEGACNPPSGVDYCEFTVYLDDEEYDSWTAQGEDGEVHEEIVWEEESRHRLEIRCVDNAGNEIEDTELFRVDNTAPETGKSFDGPSKTEGGVTWIDGVTEVLLSAQDPDPTGESCNVGNYLTWYVNVLAEGDSACYEGCEPVCDSPADVNPECVLTGVGYCTGSWDEEHSSFEECVDMYIFEECGIDCAGEMWRLDTGEAIPKDEESCHVFQYFSTDYLLNIEDMDTDCFFVDKTPPELDMQAPEGMVSSEDDIVGGYHWLTQDMPLTFTCIDQEPHPSGDEELCYKVKWDDGVEAGSPEDLVYKTGDYCDEELEDGWCCVPAGEPVEFYFQEDSLHSLEYLCRDAVDKMSEPELDYFRVDTVPPHMEKTMFGNWYGECPPMAEGDMCYVMDDDASGVTIDVVDGGDICASDDVECNYNLWWLSDECFEVQVQNGHEGCLVDSGDFSGNADVVFIEESEHELEVHCEDALGNTLYDIEHFYVDATPPLSTKSFYGPYLDDGGEYISSETIIGLAAVDHDPHPSGAAELMHRITLVDDGYCSEGCEQAEGSGEWLSEGKEIAEDYGDGFDGLTELPEENIVETAVGAGNLTTLVAALEATGLDTVLQGDGPFTVFAPTDEAFDKLGEGTVEALLEDPDALSDILLYHVIGQGVIAADVVQLESALMANAKRTEFSLDGGVFINDAEVKSTDVLASNGVIHVIDTVIIPPAGLYYETQIEDESCHLIEHKSVDNLGNAEEVKRQCVYVDNTPPEPEKTVGENKLECNGGVEALEECMRTYTTDSDFEDGTLDGLNMDVSDQLQLNLGEVSTFPTLWIANSGDPSLSKWDTETNKELARYQTFFGELGSYGSHSYAAPSRTAVDVDGNVYVANRHFDSDKPAEVIKVLTDDFIDRNGNGVPDTSYDVNDDGVIDPSEMMPLNDSNGNDRFDQDEIQDERIAWVVQVGTDNCLGRSLAIDLDGNIWLGCFNERAYYKLDGDDGSLLDGPIDVSPNTPYGALVDKHGILWGASLGTTLLKLDTETNTKLDIYSHADLGRWDYGLALGYDENDSTIVYQAARSGGTFYRFASDDEEFTMHSPVSLSPYGIARDTNGDIFIGHQSNGNLYKFMENGTLIWEAPAQVASEIRGVVVDSSNNVWAIHRSAHQMSKFDGSDGTGLGTFQTGQYPYTYSDATGISLRGSVSVGTWTVVYDSGTAGTAYDSLEWTNDVPEDTEFSVRVRASEDESAWSSWETVERGEAVDPSGRYLEIEVFMKSTTEESPVLYDLTVNAECGTPDEGMDCWWVNDETPVTLDCIDPEPHPVGRETVCYRVAFDEEPWLTSEYCEAYGGQMASVEDDAWCCAYVGEEPYLLNFMEDSEHELEFYCRDYLGNEDDNVDVEEFRVDSTPPSWDLMLEGPSFGDCPPAELDDVCYVDSETSIGLDPEDGGEVCAVGFKSCIWRYRVDEGNWSAWDGEWPAGFPEESNHELEVKCADLLQNSRSEIRDFIVDKTPPMIEKSYYGPFVEDEYEYISSETVIGLRAYDQEPHPSGAAELMHRITLVDDQYCMQSCESADGSGEWLSEGKEIVEDYGDGFDGLTELPEEDIVETVVGAGNFTTLVAALEATGLDTVLQGDGPFTVFAPTDEAFDKLGEGTVEALLEDPDALSDILLYHVIAQGVIAADVVQLESALMANAKRTEFSLDGGVFINDAQVKATDVLASNGVIHVIDTVILPPAGLYYETNIEEDSCHLIEAKAVDNVGKESMHRQCVFVDDQPPEPQKTVSEPKTEWDGADSLFYPWIGDYCWNGQEDSIDCWKVTMTTPIDLECVDQDPHPVEQETVCFNVELDAEDWTGHYCEYYEGEYNASGGGYCCLDHEIEGFMFREESEHNLKYYCLDGLGNEGSVDEEKFKVEGTTFEIPLYKKWNLISVPFTLLNDDPDQVFGMLENVSAVWAYDSVESEWLYWFPDDEVNDTLEHVRPGWGYWALEMEDTEVLTLGGSLMQPGAMPPSRDLVPGWNLIGYYGTGWQQYDSMADFESYCGEEMDDIEHIYGDMVYCSLNSLVDTQEGYPRWSSLWGYINCGEDVTYWTGLDACVDGLDKMYAGRGYWIELDVEENYAPATNCIWSEGFQCYG